MPRKSGRNIVLLSDGTGNSAAKIWKTNVWRTYQALDLADQSQIARYDDGVGSSSFKPWAILTGAVGFGLKRNMLDLYMFLCRSYATGDRIYGFGFSRGAFTIRELVGLITCEGLVRAGPKGDVSEGDLRKAANAAYRSYREETQRTSPVLFWPRKLRDWLFPAQAKAREARRSAARRNRHRPDIHFLGLWDTVAAYGLPIEEMKRGVDLYFWPLSLPNRQLHKKVKTARHALALDDERLTFHPVLWTEKGEKKASRIQRERLTQVWFAGVHTNVGGGYPDDSLAHVPLNWMLDEAVRCGLKFKPDMRKQFAEAANARGRIYDSRHGLAAYYRYAPRRIASLANDTFDKDDQVLIALPKIHESVFDRIRDSNQHYAPIVLPEKYAVVTRDGAIKSGNANPFEHPTQSKSRANEQEKAWNWVWARRVSYFATLGTSLALVAFPVFNQTSIDGACVHETCTLSHVVGAVGGFLPEPLSPWTDSYKANPLNFFGLVVLLVLFLMLGGWMQKQITSGMRRRWSAIIGHRHKTKIAALPGDLLYKLRTRHWYNQIFRSLRRSIVPTAFAAMIAFLAVVVASRVAFSGLSASGHVCKGTAELADVAKAVTKEGFTSAAVCWPTGYRLLPGTTYRIIIELTDEAAGWGDSNVGASSLVGYGFRDLNDIRHWLQFSKSVVAVLFRRSITANWLQPIARIGAIGTDEYRLEPTLKHSENESWTRLTSDIQARSDGELFLYANDTVIGVPRYFGWFYPDNIGTARVTIEPK